MWFMYSQTRSRSIATSSDAGTPSSHMPRASHADASFTFSPDAAPQGGRLPELIVGVVLITKDSGDSCVASCSAPGCFVFWVRSDWTVPQWTLCDALNVLQC